jgi:hypothetical protein
MKIIPLNFYPLTIFNIHGTFCCKEMYNSYSNYLFEKENLVFSAHSLVEANTFILWGNFSELLINLIQNQLILLPKKRVFIHLQDCTNNDSINKKIHIDLKYNNCDTKKLNIKNLIMDIRKCLKE